MKKLLTLLTALALGFTGSQAQIVISPGGGAASVISAIGGAGLTLSNVTINCTGTAYGTYSNAAASGFGASMTNGLLLTTGSASGVAGSGNLNDDYSTCVGTSSTDAQLVSVIGGATINDACIIEFDVVPQCNNLQIRFVFGSDEYTNWVSAGFNDGFGFFVSGPNPAGGNYTNYNLAQLPSGTLVSIDNVNTTTNPAYFINNNAGTYANHFDGFTTVLNPTMNVTPCQSYHFKLAIGDAADCAMDSGVMIDLIQCTSPWTVATSSTPTGCGAPSGTATATVSGGIGPFTYSWAPTGGTGPTASGLAAGSYTVTINDGLTCTPLAQTYTVTVGTTGTPNTVTVPASNSYCSGATVPASTYTSTPAGGTFTWTNSNTAIGLGASGAGNQPSFTATNPGTTAISGTITVTPTVGGCPGTPNTYTITVKPIPNVTPPANITVCAGSTVAASAFTSNVAGATFAWTNSNPAIGLGASGAGNTPSFTATNATASNITATITVTPTATGCPGTPVTYTITVKPVPTVTVPASSTVCNGTPIAASAFTSGVAGTTYAWTNSNAAIGLGASGAGNTPAFTATNAGAAAISGTITVTPTANACPGTPVTYTITVNPTPTVTVPANITVCAGINVPASAFTSNVAGATFAWTNSNAAIGLPASGAGNTPAFTATNATGSPITSTITVTPTANTCPGTPVTYTITVNPMPVVTVNSPSICPGGTATLTATGGTTYSWSSGPVTNPITVSPASTTSYTVTGTSSGCSNSAVATVTVGASMTITVNSPGICTGQTANLIATGATSYTWSAGATSTGAGTADASPAATTSYTVTGTTGGCTGTAVATVTVTSTPVVTVTSPTICDGQTATMTAGGAATYTWSAGATTAAANTATAAPSTTTTYTVTGSNGGCSGTAVSTVTVNPIPTVTVNSPTICAGQTANLTAGGATGYTWSAGATFTGANTADASPASTTTYTVTGTSAGCSNTAVSTVTVAPSLNVTVNSPTICAGQTANLTAAGATTYVWTAGATSTGASTADATPAATTTYTVTGTTSGCTGSAISTVTVTPLPAVTVNSPTVCNGVTANLTAGGASTYAWSAGATSTGANTADAAPSTTTTYTVTGTTSGCSNTAVSTVTVNPIPNVTVNSPSICPGSTAMLTAGGATSYTWSAGATSTGANTATATPAATTTYTVTGTSLGCSNTAVSTVTVNTVLSVDAGVDDSICFGGSATLTVIPNGVGYVYTWTPAASLSNATIYNPVASPAATTTYTVNVTDANGCTGSDNVTIFADPQITLALAGLPVNCNGGSDGQTIVIPAGGSGSYTYNWLAGGCTTAACNVAAGTYTVTVTDTWGCTATGTSTVTEPTAVTATSTQVNVTCFGACNGTATATGAGGTPTASGGYNYSWNTVPVQNTQTATGLCSGTYTCTVTDANGCSTTVVVTITEPTVLAVAPILNVTICNSGSTTLNANVTGGTGAYTYSWSPATGLSSASVANPTASPAGTTSYTVTATDANGCTATASVTVTVNPPLSVVTAGTASVCPGFSTPISAIAANGAGSGYTYSWSPAAGLSDPAIDMPTATPAVTTTYTVTVNDGCSPAVTATVTVTALPKPVPVITSNVTSGCAPLCVSFTDASTISSGSVAGWDWNFGDNGPDSISQNPSHCFMTAGSYTITLTDTSAAGCITTSTIPYVITVNPIPVAAASAPTSTSIFTPTVQYIDQSTISFGSIVSWDWSFGDNLSTPANDSSSLQNPSHLFSEIGSYCGDLVVTSNAGCRDTTSICIIIDPEFTFFIPNAFSPNDDGINDEFYGKGEYIKKYEMYIYDRWGNMIFAADDINKHWDGKANHGAEIAQEDVYVYVVKLTDNHDKNHKYIGTVTIVK